MPHQPEPEIHEKNSTDPKVLLSLKLEDWLSVIIISLLACITFANVVVRYLTSDSFAWTEEISVFLLIVLTMAGAASAYARNQHIRIEFLADRGSPKKQRYMAIAANIAVLMFFLLLAVLSVRMVYDDFTWGDTSPAIGIPSWWYSVWMPVFSMLIVARVAGVLWRKLRDIS